MRNQILSVSPTIPVNTNTNIPTIQPVPAPSGVAASHPHPVNAPVDTPGAVPLPISHIGVGIDVGMTYTGAALYCEYFNGQKRFEHIRLDIGLDQNAIQKFPSLVYIFQGTLDGALVGKEAKDQLLSNDPGKLYPLFKRDLGSNWRDTATSQEITAVILTKLLVEHVQHKVQEYLKTQRLSSKPVHYTFTYPSTWSQDALRAFKDAISRAGITHYTVLEEPLAAAVGAAYLGKDKRNRKVLYPKQKVLICDLGGGTLDLSLITPQRGQQIQVNATTGGDGMLGMSNLDKLLALYLMCRQGFLVFDDLDEIGRKIKYVVNTPVARGDQLEEAWRLAQARRNDPHWWSWMLQQCEVLKRQVCTFWNSQDRWLFTFPDGVQTTINRQELDPFVNSMNATIRTATMRYLNELRTRIGFDPTDITHVVISGGGSHLPKVRETFHQIAPRAEFPRIEEDDVMTLVQGGAAVHAFRPEIVQERRSNASYGLWTWVADTMPPYPGAVDTAKLVDYRGHGHTMYQTYIRFIERNDPFPNDAIKMPMHPLEDGMREVSVPVLQGENDDPRKNKQIGVITMRQRANATHRDQFNILFEFTDEGLIQVRGEDDNGQVVEITFDPDDV